MPNDDPAPTREQAEAAVDALSMDAIKAVIQGDADRARRLRAKAKLGKDLLDNGPDK